MGTLARFATIVMETYYKEITMEINWNEQFKKFAIASAQQLVVWFSFLFIVWMIVK